MVAVHMRTSVKRPDNTFPVVIPDGKQPLVAAHEPPFPVYGCISKPRPRCEPRKRHLFLASRNRKLQGQREGVVSSLCVREIF